MAIEGQFGGRITFQFAGQNIPPCDGDIIIDPSLVEVDGMANQDGSAAYKQKPKLVSAKFKLRHTGNTDWNAIMFMIGNLTITEQNNGRTHLFTNTRMVGKPDVNLSSGEVDGLSCQGGTYTRVDS
jgi:hypothetical protein